MTDVLTPAQRRLNMSRVRGTDTRPELLIRSGLHRRGLRYRLHETSLPGRPDLVFPKHHAVVFVHGCFWHAHGCSLFRMPATRPDFWKAKLSANRTRDSQALEQLAALGWRVLVIWECALRGPGRWDGETLLNRCDRFVRSSEASLEEIAGEEASPAVQPSTGA